MGDLMSNQFEFKANLKGLLFQVSQCAISNKLVLFGVASAVYREVEEALEMVEDYAFTFARDETYVPDIRLPPLETISKVQDVGSSG